MLAIMREHKLIETFLNPLSAKLLNRYNLDNTTEEEKKAIARSFNQMHQEEVQLIMRYGVAKREKVQQELVEQALHNLKTFIQNFKHKKVAESPLN